MTSSRDLDDALSEPLSPEGIGAQRRQQRDAFDDVPEDGERAGTHRAADAPVPRAIGHILGLLIAGGLALLIGAGAYLLSGSNQVDPGEAGATSAPSPIRTTPSPDAEVVADDTIQVGVYSAASVDGAAGEAAQKLSRAGWTVASIDNWGVGVNQSAVYYSGEQDGEQEQARAIAEELGIENVAADDAVSYPIVVVIGTDIAGGPTAAPVEGAQPPTQQAPDPVAPEPAPEAPAEQAPAEQAPAEQAPVEPAPVEQAPVEQAPVAPAPVEPAPDYGAPAQQAPPVPGAGGGAW